MSTPVATFQRAVLAPPGWATVWQMACDAERLAAERWPDTCDVPVACTVTPGRLEGFRCLALSVPPEWAQLYRMVENAGPAMYHGKRFAQVSALVAHIGLARLRVLRALSATAYRKAVETALRELP